MLKIKMKYEIWKGELYKSGEWCRGELELNESDG